MRPVSSLRGPLGLVPGQSAPRLYDRVVEALRARHYSRRTEEACVHWIRRYLLFHDGGIRASWLRATSTAS